MKLIHELFETQAALRPDSEALVFETSILSYSVLNQRADAIAQRMRAIGVGPDSLVGLYLDRSPDMIAGMLGVLKAGGAYVPLDPALPVRRLAYMLEDAKPVAVLTEKKLQNAMPAHKAVVVVMDDIPQDAEPATPVTDSPRHSDLSPDHLAYVIYTSGSTGNPKGVQVRHGGVVNMLHSMRRRPGMLGTDRMLALTTMAFDISVLEIFLPLSFGATAVIASSATARDGAALRKLIETGGITTMQATPATLQMLLEAGWQGAKDLTVLCGGEAWSIGLSQQLLARCGALWNMYGPTETTVWSAVAKVEAGGAVVVGRPIANTRFYVLDNAAQLVPLGVPGELYIGGDGVARGYLNRPELSAERFVEDPFVEREAKMYRTGDLVKRLQDGTLQFLGRIDHQVKIRGHRVELGEIESVLLNHPDVERSVAIAYTGADGMQNLAAYYASESDRTIPPQELRLFLSERLPAYMIPNNFVPIAAFPLTPSGKVDRKALPIPQTQLQKNTLEHAEPVTAMEKQLAGIWAEMLKVPQVGLEDNFFDLGGHSLLALRTINEMNKVLNTRLNVPDFFQNPTIGQLVAEMSQHRQTQAATRVIPLQKKGSGLPVYFMGARPDEYRLAQLISERRAVFLIDVSMPAEWIDAVSTEDSSSLPTIEEMGELFGRALFAHAGTQPCVIAGYSLGGKLAFEAAHTLQRAGGNTAFLLLVDSRAFTWSGLSKIATVLRSGRIALGGISFRPGTAKASLRRLVEVTEKGWRLIRWQISSIPTAIGYRLRVRNNRRRAIALDTTEQDAPSGYFDSEGKPIGMWVVYRMATLIGATWRPKPLEIEGALIRGKADVDMLSGYDRAHGWRDLCRGGFEIVQSEGDHVSILTETHAPFLSEQIEMLLSRRDDLRRDPLDHLARTSEVPAGRHKFANPSSDFPQIIGATPVAENV